MADRRTDVLFGQDTINDGPSTRAVTALALSIDGTVLYAATEGAGVFRLGEAEIGTIYLPLVLAR